MATRTYNAIDKTIDGLRLEEFDGAVEQLAQPFSNKNVYDIGRYVVYEGSIYQKITEPHIKNLLSRPYPLQLTTGNVLEENGITWSINTNGSITANGTATDDTSFLVDTNIITGEDYDYYKNLSSAAEKRKCAENLARKYYSDWWRRTCSKKDRKSVLKR